MNLYLVRLRLLKLMMYTVGQSISLRDEKFMALYWIPTKRRWPRL